MKAAQISTYGGQDVLKTQEAEKPTIGDGQVLVEVYAAGINPFDLKMREGYMQDFLKFKFPATLGGDFAGVIVDIGDGVYGYEIGESVYGLADAGGGIGSFAEYTPVKATQLALKPNQLDYISSAALPLAGCSAYQAIYDHINLQAGQRILIHGGGGGIGALAIQLAKQLGAYVATTVSSKDIDYAKQLGADEVIDYASEDFSTKINNFDGVLDTVGGDTATKSSGVLKPGGTLVSMVGSDGSVGDAQNIKFIHQRTRANKEILTKLAQLVDAGQLKVNVDRVFPLDNAAEALEYLKNGHPRGKVVIQVKQ